MWLYRETIKTPPFSKDARRMAGELIRRLQQGEEIKLKRYFGPMQSIGPRCHELKIKDLNTEWRIIYRIDSDAIIIVEVFKKKTNKTPKHIIELCKERLSDYDQRARG